MALRTLRMGKVRVRLPVGPKVVLSLVLCYYLNMKYKNTLNKGSVRFLIFRDGESWFGVALEFNVVVEAANPQEAYIFLNEATSGYLESARKAKLRPIVLNQKPEAEYEKMWQANQDAKLKAKYEKIVNNLPIFSSGVLDLAVR